MQVEPTRKRKRASAKTKAPKDPNAPKRATTGFFFFSQEERPNIRAKNPALKITEISQQLGKLWREMDDKTKEKYLKMAEKDKKRYEAVRLYKCFAYEVVLKSSNFLNLIANDLFSFFYQQEKAAYENRVSQGSGDYEDED